MQGWSEIIILSEIILNFSLPIAMTLYKIFYVLFQSIQNIHEITQIEFINIKKVDFAPDTSLHTVRQQMHF